MLRDENKCGLNNSIILNVTKILLIVIFILILLCIYIVSQTPGVRGYEISLYNEYPMHFWYLIILCIAMCHGVILLTIFFETTQSISWKLACSGIVLSNSILLLVPLIRRYAIYGPGDPSTHMGYMLDIIQTGHIYENSYPIAHIFAVISRVITDLDLSIFMALYPTILYISYMLSFYLLYRFVLESKNSILIGAMLVPLLFSSHGNISFSPQTLSNYYIIFMLYLFFKKSDFYCDKTFQYSILAVVISIFITFFHPVASIFLIITVGIYEILYATFRHFRLFSYEKLGSGKCIMLIMIAIYFTWHSYATLLFGSFRRVYAWLYQEASGMSPFESHLEQIAEFKPDLFFLLNKFIYSYGLWLLYLFVGIISILIILNALKRNELALNINLATFSGGFILFFVIYILSQFIVTGGTGYRRAGHYAVIFALLLIPVALDYLLDKYKKITRRYMHILVFLFLFSFCVTYLSVYTLYLSPITSSAGQHVADSQLIGMDTFFKIRSEDLQIMEGGISADRIKDALCGRSTILKNVVYRKKPSIPYHFNYNDCSYFGNYYDRPVYVVISKLFRICYPILLPEYQAAWRFNQTDFYMLENDKSVSRVYSNYELDVYLLNPILKEEQD